MEKELTIEELAEKMDKMAEDEELSVWLDEFDFDIYTEAPTHDT